MTTFDGIKATELPDDPFPPAVTPAAPQAGSLRERTAALAALHEKARTGPTDAQHSRGKLTVWERLELLLDDGSFTEIEGLRQHRANAFGLAAKRPHGDGVVTGWGTIDGRTVFVYGHDFRAFGGSLGEAHAQKIHKLMDLALAANAPLIGLNDGAGARIQEGVTALAGYGGIFQRHVRASGVIPQISVMLGPCAGGAAYSPALTDVVFMVHDTAQMFITGPDVVAAVTGESVTHNELGGADVHATRSGVATFDYADEISCLQDVRYLVSMLPASSQEFAPVRPAGDPADRRCEALLDLVPTAANKAYDMRVLVEEVVDDGELMEFHQRWAPNIIVGLARIEGHVTGIVANQPMAQAGVLDIQASEKAARFVQFCDAFNIALVTFVDVPGFLPGTSQEHGGIIRHGAKLLHAYCDATVPRVQVIVRKAYGGAYIVMDSRSIGADLSYAWPGNEIAVMGAEAAANVIFRKEIAAADDPTAVRAMRVADYQRELMHPYYAAERGLVDDVIDPGETRATLARSLRMLRDKRVPLPHRKHSNPPQ